MRVHNDDDLYQYYYYYYNKTDDYNRLCVYENIIHYYMLLCVQGNQPDNKRCVILLPLVQCVCVCT